MGNPIYIDKALTTVNGSAIAQPQSLLGAGDFVLNGSLVTGGVAVLDTQRQLRFLASTDDNWTGVLFTIYGADDNGVEIVDEVTVPVGTLTVDTNIDFKTVTRVSASASPGANVQIGTTSTGSTPWHSVGPCSMFMALGVALIPAGAATFQFQYTLDDPANLPAGVLMPHSFNLSLSNNAGSIITPIFAWRLRLQTTGVAVRGSVVLSGLGVL